MKKDSGFTLLEIMIVVAVIGVLAAIAIPNLMRARVNAHEAAVKSDLKTFSAASESFRQTGVVVRNSAGAGSTGCFGGTPISG